MTAHKQQLKEAAIDYLEHGWSVIPLQGKRPTLAWKEYQTRMATKEEIEAWFVDESVTGVGIVTGSISKLIELDIDRGSSYPTETLPETASVITGDGGFHYYFEYHSEEHVKNKVSIYSSTDIRAEGGYVVAPPSLHPETGEYYRWSIRRAPVEVPSALLQDIVQSEEVGHSESDGLGDILTGVTEGSSQ